MSANVMPTPELQAIENAGATWQANYDSIDAGPQEIRGAVNTFLSARDALYDLLRAYQGVQSSIEQLRAVARTMEDDMARQISDVLILMGEAQAIEASENVLKEWAKGNQDA